MTQLALVKPDLRPLTARQQIIHDRVLFQPGGMTADELGAWIHAERGRHPEQARCLDCGRDGLRAMREKALAQRFTRRRASGRYEPRERPARLPAVPLPGTTWEDIFA